MEDKGRVKECKICKEVKSITSFYLAYKLEGKRPCYSSYCKTCSKKHGIENGKKGRLKVLQHYSNSVNPFCACCGEDEIVFLVVDHLKGGGLKDRMARGGNGSAFYYNLIRHDFPSGYRILCHNCNHGVRLGKCPHQLKESVKRSFI